MKHEVFQTGGSRLLIWDLTESIDELVNQANLTPEEQIDFDKLHSDKRKSEFLGIRIALKELLGVKALIVYDNQGKPFLFDKSYKISISHSKNWIAVMAHPNRSVGIDIEIHTDKIKRIYHRFLSDIEQKELLAGEDIQQLMIAWSAKETMFKIIGNEAVDFAWQLRIFPFELNETGEISVLHVPTQDIYSLNYIQNSDYTLVYCLA